MNKVFISYSHSDSDTADSITTLLDELGIECYRDIKEIDWGSDVDSGVKIGLVNCIAVLVIISPGSVKSQWVPYEIGYANALRKRILPFITHQKIDLPPYISRLHYTSKLQEIRKYFTSPKTIRTLIKSSSEYMDNKLEPNYIDWWENENEKRQDTTVTFDGVEVTVDRTVFSPCITLTYSTYIAAKLMPRVKGKRVLDIGTGCGILAIIALKRGASFVLATDIDPSAVDNAIRNVKRHRLSQKINVIKSDLFDRVKGKFDVVLANLPIAQSATAWSHLDNNYRTLISRFAKDLKKHLSDNGIALLSWASFGDQEMISNVLAEEGLVHREFSEKTFGATWQVFQIKLHSA